MNSTSALTVSPLRRRMLCDIAVRNFSPDTQPETIRHLAFVSEPRKLPRVLSPEDVL